MLRRLLVRLVAWFIKLLSLCRVAKSEYIVEAGDERKSTDNDNNNNNLSLPLPLPEDLIVEILLSLPVKSLVRFRCVSKSWLSLISDPKFAKSHFELAAAPSHRLLYIPDNGYEARSIDLDASLHDNSAAVKLNYRLPTSNIRGSSRGFILLEDHLKFIIWNPSTGVSYPPFSLYEHTDEVLYGFGYDAATDDYLVVLTLLDYWKADSVAHLEIFSVRTYSWKEIKGIHFPYTINFNNYGLFLNGALHWMANRDDSSVVVIIAFDLIQRNFSEIILPDGFNYRHFSHLLVLRGCLGLCCRGDNNTGIWMMKEYKVHSSWTKCFVVPASVVRTNYFYPTCLTKGGNIIGLSERTKLVKLNDKGKLLESRAYCDAQIGCRTAMYTESLLSLPTVSRKQRKMTNSNK